MLWWIAAALADPRARGDATAIEDRVVPPPNVEIVPQLLEGTVRMVMAGREGDSVFVDGWPAGALPAETLLSEGPHLFRVEGKAGKHQVELMVTIAPAGKVTEVDLAQAPTPPTPPSVTPAPAP